MKRLLSVFLSSALLALSLGPATPAAVAQVVAPVQTLGATAAPVPALPAINPGVTSSLSAPALNGGLLAPGLSLKAAPGIAAIQPAVPQAAAFGAAAPQTLAAPAATRSRALGTAGEAAAGSLAQRALQTPSGEQTPLGAGIQALSAPALDSKDMGSAQASNAAEADFQKRAGGSGLIAGSQASSDEIELLVSAPEGSGKNATEDVYPLSLSNPGIGLKQIDAALAKQLQNLGIPMDVLTANKARAIGVVAKINTAVLKVSGVDAVVLWGLLEKQGLKVQRGRTFEVPKPQAADERSRTVGLKETAAIYGADKLQAALAKVLGEPGKKAGFIARAKAWVGRALGLAVENPVLPWAILDTWVATTHPYLKDRMLKSVGNDPDSETHGSHTASTVVGMDRWNFAGRNYNIFPGGSADESDILFKLNMAQEDGAVGTTHSWGDGTGDPEGAIEKLFVKGAEKGIHHSISAGNSGSRANTIGGPAIMYYNVDLVINGKVIGQVKRIKAIAAADADKKLAYFSSRGPGSRTTANNPKYKDWPMKPDETGMGVNLVAAVPSGATVPELGGPGESMSGTSMSNPGVFGSFLLLTRGILVLLKDYLPAVPSAQQTQFALDLARYAMTQTGQKLGQATDYGDGFINVWSAFEYAGKLLKENAPGKAAPAVGTFLRGWLGAAPNAPAQEPAVGRSNEPRSARDLSMKEFALINLTGIAGSILGGVLLHSALLAILGSYVAAIPLILAYVGIRRLLGDNLSVPGIRFSPGISWAGKQHSLIPPAR